MDTAGEAPLLAFAALPAPAVTASAGAHRSPTDASSKAQTAAVDATFSSTERLTQACVAVTGCSAALAAAASAAPAAAAFAAFVCFLPEAAVFAGDDLLPAAPTGLMASAVRRRASMPSTCDRGMPRQREPPARTRHMIADTSPATHRKGHPNTTSRSLHRYSAMLRAASAAQLPQPPSSRTGVGCVGRSRLDSMANPARLTPR